MCVFAHACVRVLASGYPAVCLVHICCVQPGLGGTFLLCGFTGACLLVKEDAFRIPEVLLSF